MTDPNPSSSSSQARPREPGQFPQARGGSAEGVEPVPVAALHGRSGEISASVDPIQTQFETSPGQSGGRPSLRNQIFQNPPRHVGDYEILSILGAGGMGAVFLAHEPLLDRVVALKLLNPEKQENMRHAARFLSETILTGQLQHAGIIPIYHVGYDEEMGYFYTMRYVKGVTLADILQKWWDNDAKIRERFSFTRLLTVFLRICEATGFAHRNGIVHRDLKPANVMLTEFNEVLVLDWGLAKKLKKNEPVQEVDKKVRASCRIRHASTTRIFLSKHKKGGGAEEGRQTGRLQALKTAFDEPGSDLEQMTQNEHIVGTPAYMSPELGSGKPELTPASDVYTLGVILYEILTGWRPVHGKDAYEVIAKTVSGATVPIRDRTEGKRQPQALCDIVNRALARDPLDRYRDGEELAEDLRLYLDGRAPYRLIMRDDLGAEPLERHWTFEDKPGVCNGQGLELLEGARIAAKEPAPGDFRVRFFFSPLADSDAWRLAFQAGELQKDLTSKERYEIVFELGNQPLVELRREGKTVQRRFDVRFQNGQQYAVEIEVEGYAIRAKIDAQTFIEYQEPFPHTGSMVAFRMERGRVELWDFGLWSRGAPLNLPFLYMPDRLYRMGKYQEARELYLNLAESHPDREEGLMALYKGGLCAAELKDIQAAFDDFTRLEGTMLDHYCALGLAQIGLLDGNIDWAWEALKNAYQAERDGDIRAALWFSLLALVESIPLAECRERIKRYKELMEDLHPEPKEARKVAFDLLNLVHMNLSVPDLRSEIHWLLQNYPNRIEIVTEALSMLSRIGMDEASMPVVEKSLMQVMDMPCENVTKARFHLVCSEWFMSEGRFQEALTHLTRAHYLVTPSSSEALWAKGWTFLIQYMNGRYQETLLAIHKEFTNMRRAPVAQKSYFRVIEGLAYLAREDRDQAWHTVQHACDGSTVWGKAAKMILTGQEPAGLREMVNRNNSNQVTEALFLIGEANLLLGNLDLAQEFYEVTKGIERILFTRLAQKRLDYLDVIRQAR